MNLHEIEELIRLIEHSGVKEFTLKEGNLEISINTRENSPAPAAPLQPVPCILPYPGMPAALPSEAAQAPAAKGQDEDSELICSPIVATFYSSPAPDIPAFVRVGERVRNGQTICILEAMKLMNEITADYDCEIEAILVSNEQHVEYGQPLFRVKKL